MVMEKRDPDPQCVGREFVRQYYTLLHEAPDQLHRFYSDNSCFIHGGVEKPGEEQSPVRGQQAIHDKVMSLKFRDCRAKIRQVDSQATVGNAVVVQVTGELSNNCLPMRRFMQTFVLVRQEPKKYYVHNDIFRYQDEVFHDVDTDTEHEEEAGDTCGSLMDDVDCPSEQDHEDLIESYETTVMSNGTAHLEEPAEPPVVENAVEEPVVIQPPEEEAPVVPEPVTKPEPPIVEPEPIEPETSNQPKGEGILTPEYLDTQKTFSWAAMAGKNTSTGSIPPSQVQSTSVGKVPIKPVVPEVKPTEVGGGSVPQPQRLPRSTRDRSDAVRERGSQGGSIGRGEGDGEESVRKTLRYPDNQQLFVGNLPLNTSEVELREYFEEYGKVVDLKINTKPGGAGKVVPNYGFIVFDSSESVQKVLNQKSLKKFRKDHRLNVEEKKARGDSGRPGSGTRSGRGGGGDRGGMGRGGMPGRGGGRPGLPGGGGGSRPDNRGSERGGRGGFGVPRR